MLFPHSSGREGKGVPLLFRTYVGYVSQEKLQQIQFLLCFSAYNFSSSIIVNNSSGQMDGYNLFRQKKTVQKFFLLHFSFVCISPI